MSDGSGHQQKILSEPLKNIGAQDLLTVGSTYEGVLRKRGGRLEKFLNIGEKFLGSVKWKHRFVVLSQGCIYCFKDEYSQRPQSAFSLTVYESVRATTDANMLNVFEIKHENEAKPSHVFSCETDAKRKLWIAQIEEAVRQAHHHSGGSQKLSNDSDEGIAMSTTASRKSRAFLPPLPPTPDETGVKYKRREQSEYSLESDEEQEPYDEVVTHSEADNQTAKKVPFGAFRVMPGNKESPGKRGTMSTRPSMPLPMVPKEPKAAVGDSQSNRRKQGYEDPVASALQKTKLTDYLNEQAFPQHEYTFDSKDKVEAQRLLIGKPIGTFLVRQGNSTPLVLTVLTDQGVKEFQISESPEKKVTLNRTEYFPSLNALLCFYKTNDLPKREYSVKLQRGYKS